MIRPFHRKSIRRWLVAFAGIGLAYFYLSGSQIWFNQSSVAGEAERLRRMTEISSRFSGNQIKFLSHLVSLSWPPL
jgi:hypothetical protein